MANSGLGYVIRREMAKQGMSEDALLEGCKEIVAEHEASERERADKRAFDQMRGYAEESQKRATSVGSPEGDLKGWLERKMRAGD